MHQYAGKCDCGEVTFTINLPQTIDLFSPRQCDCDFCMARNIAYLSHPKGYLVIETTGRLASQQQGSKQAGFLTCPQCESVIAASLNLENGLIGALNANLLSDSSLLPPATIVSPKLLDAQNKRDRWQQVWSKITINVAE